MDRLREIGEAVPFVNGKTILSRVQDTVAEVERLRVALGEIAEGRGRFSLDHFQHAKNTIEDMKEIAQKAIDKDVA